MNAHNISVKAGSCVALKTAGTFCDKDIVVTAEGGGESYQDGWSDGHSDGYQEGYTAGYDGGYDEGQYDGIVSGIEIGKKAEYDLFWDMFQENGNRTDYRYAFAYTKWNDGTFNPKYPLKFVGDATCAFLSTEFVWADKVLRVDLSEATYLYWTFRNNKFTYLGKCDLSSATNITGIFSLCFNLKSIEEIVSHEGLPWHDAFTYDAGLEDITFSGVIGKNISLANSNKLTTASVQSIIDHLKDLTGATTQTLTFHADVKGKLTDAQKAAITAKNWQLG